MGPGTGLARTVVTRRGSECRFEHRGLILGWERNHSTSQPSQRRATVALGHLCSRRWCALPDRGTAARTLRSGPTRLTRTPPSARRAKRRARARSLGSEGRAGALGRHLEGDLAFVLEVFGEVHGGHAAFAEAALDAVAVGESGAEPLDDVGHRISRGSSLIQPSTHTTLARRSGTAMTKVCPSAVTS